MPSAFAAENGHKIARLLKYYDGPPYNIPEILDTELQEVREVLALLRQYRVDGKPCWCVSRYSGDFLRANDDHDEPCQRARALTAQLRVDGAS